MSRLLKRVSVATAVAGVSILLLGAMAYASGARINSSSEALSVKRSA